VCQDGEIHCVDGCLACTQTVFPSEELCDGLDNDCDGPVDNDATKMGAVPPPLAAKLEDLSAPLALAPGEAAQTWALFRNVGTAPWPAASTWLQAAGADGGPSPLLVPEGWAAHDVAVAAAEPVAPGEAALFAFPVHMPSDGQAGTTSFELAVEGVALACPSPGFMLDPVALAAKPAPLPLPDAPDAADADAADAGDAPVDAASAGVDAAEVVDLEEDSAVSGGGPLGQPAPDAGGEASGSASGGCAHGDRAAPSSGVLALFALLLAGIRRSAADRRRRTER
jgi:hypothetical protein